MSEQYKKTIKLLEGANKILEDRNKLLKKENKKLKEQLALSSVVSMSKCDHEPKSTNRKYTSCKKCNMHLQMKP